MKHILHVVGARPNFPKCAPVHRALAPYFLQIVIHTGQHYDDNLSKINMEDTGCPCDILLDCPSHDLQASLARHFVKHKPDLVMIYGDVNSSAAATRAALWTDHKIAHVEAGLRCGDLKMQEERNRIAIDQRANWLYAPSLDAVRNLIHEGYDFPAIQFVGNVMADSYQRMLLLSGGHCYSVSDYGVVTMHRPENVDNPDFMCRFMKVLARLTYPLVFPKHPRVTVPYVPANVTVREPMSYKTFGHLLLRARFVITDSGGVQEETTLAGIPCLTMRPSTERPVTITEGTNELSTPETLSGQVASILTGHWKKGSIPLLWDGHAAERIATHLRSVLS